MREAAEAAGESIPPLVESDDRQDDDDEHDIMDKQVVIVDLEGIGMSALRCLYVFKCINSVASYNYPELSKAIYVLNSPSVFDYLWSAVKPLLAAHTQSKIRIFQSGPSSTMRCSRYSRTTIFQTFSLLRQKAKRRRGGQEVLLLRNDLNSGLRG